MSKKKMILASVICGALTCGMSAKEGEKENGLQELSQVEQNLKEEKKSIKDFIKLLEKFDALKPVLNYLRELGVESEVITEELALILNNLPKKSEIKACDLFDIAVNNFELPEDVIATAQENLERADELEVAQEECNCECGLKGMCAKEAEDKTLNDVVHNDSE